MMSPVRSESDGLGVTARLHALDVAFNGGPDLSERATGTLRDVPSPPPDVVGGLRLRHLTQH